MVSDHPPRILARDGAIGAPRVAGGRAFFAHSSLGRPPEVAVIDPGAGAPRYDLEGDEVIGGHTIERHVGRTDRDLADRLRREPQISAASTYTDLDGCGVVLIWTQ